MQWFCWNSSPNFSLTHRSCHASSGANYRIIANANRFLFGAIYKDCTCTNIDTFAEMDPTRNMYAWRQSSKITYYNIMSYGAT
ncbi:hypothetical protein TRIP_B30033 [uncultured Desulfatiglans sp.]|uniref:Uncharacterized protein n=1 Tax=Uncultured Desulfatiglans sp. TaxID=1748965 RepID=A0A653A6L4_UNCDX|nr:hypothetical protein TRIP_B30033 [uncultured Desulfatiglans sp.]